MPLRYWGSGDDPETNEGQSVATLEKRGNKLYISIRVPYNWLQTAVYPVYIDTDVEADIDAGTDDGYSWGSSSFSSTATTLCAGWSGPSNAIIQSFMRFDGITIPQGSTIDVAHISCYEGASVATALTKLYADDQNDPDAPINKTDHDGRNRTTNGVDWDGDLGAAGWHDSPSIIDVIQELVTSYDYSNQAIMILHDDDGSPQEVDVAAYQNYRTWEFGSPDGVYDPTLYVEYTAGGATPDISNSPDSYAFGILETNSTALTGLDYFTVQNNTGDASAVDITISGTDMTGGVTWALSDNATPDTNVYGLKAGLDGGDYTIIVKKADPNYLKEGLADNATQDWGLKIWAPTGFTDGDAKTGKVILTASLSQ